MDIKDRIAEANQKAVNCIIDSDPCWAGIKPAGEVVKGLEDHMITHSGPPIDYENMTELHKRGMRNACLFEGWAKDTDEADAMIKAGDVRIVPALDHNTVGAGTGIITKSVAMWIVEDRANGTVSATFPAEGAAFQGGFNGWGLYSAEIAENHRFMREEIFPYLDEMVKKRGGLPIKPILSEGFQMGDENHTRQTAADMLILKQCCMDIVNMGWPSDVLTRVMNYFSMTPRMFHCLGQGAARSAALAASGTEYSTMVTAMGGNGVEFGIKVAALGDQWFTAPAPYLEGRYTSSRYSKADSLPWMGDSCVVEVAGMGGMASAASPITSLLRGDKLRDSIAQTREMEKICIGKNHNFPIPNLDFDFLPVGIDIRLVLKTGIAPVMHGGNFHKEGGLIGAGTGRAPMECFKKALAAFAQKYK